MAGQHPPLVQRFLDKLGNSRDFTISFILHTLLIILFGSTVLFKVVNEPQDFTSESRGLVQDQLPQPPRDPVMQDNMQQDVLNQINRESSTSPLPPITSDNGSFPMPDFPISTPKFTNPVDGSKLADKVPASSTEKMDAGTRTAISDFTRVWREGRSDSTGSRKPEFEFTAYIGQYSGGNWNSTIRSNSKGEIETGSLPNLLYLMSFWTKDRVRTNYRNVKAIKLDSDEIFAVKPPFIFLTGTRDFKLTDREVENLRKYVRVGGCIWGDSSVPGARSPFDLAFRREMARVVGNIDQKFEPLPANHPIYTQPYFKEVKSLPAGLNNYKLPVYAMKVYGEIAVIYTANDYGDMWQIGLDKDGRIDLRRDAGGAYVAVNRRLYDHRDIYVRNLDSEALEQSYKFGANVVMHLLTRWDGVVHRSGNL